MLYCGDDNAWAVRFKVGVVIIRKTINQNDTNGNLTFDIDSCQIPADMQLRVTQANLTSSSIIDTVHPLLYLYGANNTVHMFNHHTYAGDQSHTISHTAYKMLQVRAPLILVLLELIMSHMMHQTLQAILPI